MTAGPGQKFDREKYWAERYTEIDLSKSGHVDLPVAYNRWLYRRKKERLLDGLKRAGFEPQGASVLEVAAGTGVYVTMWQDLGVSTLSGIDLSQNATDDLARRFPQYSFCKRDLSEPGLASAVGAGYDLVTAVDMLYYVVDDLEFPVALANLAETCRPGGWFALHEVFMQREQLDAGYMKLRTLAEYRTALDRAGFEIVSRTPTFFLTVQAFDVASPMMRATMDGIWERLVGPLIRRNADLAGRLGYWSDKLIGSILNEGPSFEMMVCRRKDR